MNGDNLETVRIQCPGEESHDGPRVLRKLRTGLAKEQRKSGGCSRGPKIRPPERAHREHTHRTF